MRDEKVPTPPGMTVWAREQYEGVRSFDVLARRALGASLLSVESAGLGETNIHRLSLGELTVSVAIKKLKDVGLDAWPVEPRCLVWVHSEEAHSVVEAAARGVLVLEDAVLHAVSAGPVEGVVQLEVIGVLVEQASNLLRQEYAVWTEAPRACTCQKGCLRCGMTRLVPEPIGGYGLC